MSHFFNCIEERIIFELEKIETLLWVELDETSAPSEDMQILQDLNNIKNKLSIRINRETDRCSVQNCLRKATQHNSDREAVCRYH